jgi:hypothetical protein
MKRTAKHPKFLVSGQRVTLTNGKIATVEKFYPEKDALMAAVKLKEYPRAVFLDEIQNPENV